MHTCTQPWGQRCLQDHLCSLKSPGKPTEKMLPAAGLALSTSFINATSATTGVTANLAWPFPRSPHKSAGQDILPKESAFCGAMLRPTTHCPTGQLLLLPTASHGTPQCQLSVSSPKPSGYQQKCQELPGCSQEDGAHPKENESQLSPKIPRASGSQNKFATFLKQGLRYKSRQQWCQLCALLLGEQECLGCANPGA